MDTIELALLSMLGAVFVLAALFALTYLRTPWAIAFRSWLKVNWIKLTSGLVLFGFMLLHAATRKKDKPASVDKRETEMREKLAEARIDAALEIGKARGREEQVKTEVAKISEITDKKKQLQELADLVNRTRRE